MIIKKIIVLSGLVSIFAVRLLQAGTLELRGGYFYPTSDLFRNIYKHGGGEFEIEVTGDLQKNIAAWGNFNVFARHGNSIGLGTDTTIHLYPFSFGMNVMGSAESVCRPYVGAGFSITVVRIFNDSLFVPQNVHATTMGGVLKAGLLCNCSKNLFMDLFVDYYYTQPTIAGVSHNVGGLRSGVGLGIKY